MKCLLILALFLVSCDDSEKHPTYTAVGTVRSIWCYYHCDITFEHDTGEVQKLTFDLAPPLWVGEHVRIVYKQHPSYSYNDIVSTVRLP